MTTSTNPRNVRTTEGRPRHRTGRHGRLALLAAAVLLAGSVAASCSGTPQAVLNVPFNYVAPLRIPTVQQPSGTSSATVVMCLDTESAVFLETGSGGTGGIGTYRLDWLGTQYTAPSTGSTITWTTPVLAPGCGLLTFGPDCCHVDEALAIRATKV